jgi:hypothetical protein
MEIIGILTVIVLAALGVAGWVFYALKDQARKDLESTAVPLASAATSALNAGEETARMNKAMEEAARLKLENEAAQQELRRLQQEAAGKVSEESLMHLKAENAALKDQLDIEKKSMAALLTETGAVRAELKAQVIESEEKVARLLQEHRKQLDEAQTHSAAVSPVFVSDAVTSLKEDMNCLNEERASLLSRVDEAERLLREEHEKNEFLQYELTKSRAESAGIERICENARRQFEGKERVYA